MDRQSVLSPTIPLLLACQVYWLFCSARTVLWWMMATVDMARRVKPMDSLRTSDGVMFLVRIVRFVRLFSLPKF